MRMILTVLAAIFFAAGSAVAETPKPDLVVGDTFSYHDSWTVRSGGRRHQYVTMTYAGTDISGSHVFSLSGQPRHDTVYFTPNMSRIGFTVTHTVPHDGSSQWPHKVGQHWELTFENRLANYSRAMNCKVDKHDPNFTVQAGTFSAHRVNCTGRRLDRSASRYYEFWFDDRTGLMLKGHIWDHSGADYMVEMTSAKQVRRQARRR